MPNRIDVNVRSSSVISEFHQQLERLGTTHLPLEGGWELHSIYRGSTARFLRLEGGKLTMRPAKWGRSDAAGEGQYVDPRSPGQARRGLVVVSAFSKDIPTGFASWDKRAHRIGLKSGRWFTAGCSWTDGGGGVEFALLDEPAGPDLASKTARVPLMVPPTKRAVFLNAGSFDEFWLPPAPGYSRSCQRR
jgi:hypothetical protein